MTPYIVRYNEVASTPWKNGLGLTRQLTIHPPRAAADSFEWRLSIAELTHSVAFSSFPGVERCLAVLEGTMTLQRAGLAPLELAARSPPVRFGGEIAASALLAGGPVLDLNLMWQPQLWRAHMRQLGAASELVQPAETGTLLVCSLQSELQLRLATAPLGAARDVTLQRYDVLCVDAAAGPLSAASVQDFAAYAIELQRV